MSDSQFSSNRFNAHSPDGVPQQVGTLKVAYLMMGLNIFLPFLGIAAVIVAYITRDDVVGTQLEAHCRYLIRTFWISLGLLVAGSVLSVIVVGFVLIFIGMIWQLYRSIRGYLKLEEGVSPF